MNEYNFKCPRCRAEITIDRRFHWCEGGLRTVYVPNIGKLTKQVDPDYRKTFGSKPNKNAVPA